jgi:ribonucleoside-diphosphate reductase alpha chain
MYTYEQAIKASEEYFNGNDLAVKVFVDKYALRDNEKNILERTPYDMHQRIARELARVERGKFQKPLHQDQIFNLLNGFKHIVPQGSLLYGIGNNEQFVTLSNCYVIDSPADSYGGIHRADEHLTQISKRRGGCGLDISNLRPTAAPTRNSSRTSSGPISFMERYSHSIREVGQDGRRGALMITMNVHHPNILQFINCKRDLQAITGANISVKLTDEFLTAVKEDGEYEQRFPIDSKQPKESFRVSAKTIWKAIIRAAWEAGEPGIVFWDNIIRESVADCYADVGFITICTNPCSELPLCAYDSCRLMLLNLFSYVENPFTAKAKFNFVRFYEHAMLAQRLMDDVVDLELEAIDKIIKKIENDPESIELKRVELDLWKSIKEKCENGRRTGLGTTGLADVFAGLSLAYGSDRSVKLTGRICKTLKFASYSSSVEMAKELGAFPIWDWEKEKNHPFLNRIKKETVELAEGVVIEGYDIYHNMGEFGRRNIANLTQSPAGTVSLETETSQAFEPVYELKTKRKKKVNPSDEEARVDFTDKSGDKWMEFEVLHPKLKMWMEVTGETRIKKSPWYGSCALDVNWQSRIAVQAAAQKHIDHSISSTINLPKNVSQKVVAEIYEAAWEAGLKGITVYREGSREGVITRDEDNIRPRELSCDVHHTQVEGLRYFVLVGLDEDGKPYEIFAGRNGFMPPKVVKGSIIRQRKGYYKARFEGTDIELSPITASSTEMEGAITRLTSTALRHGADIHVVTKQLEKVGEEGSINGFARGLSRVLKKYIKDGTKEVGELCPDCSVESLHRQSGCVACSNCAWSKCV